MNWVDGVVLALLLLAALQGFQAGAVAQTLTLAGVWLGLLAGALLVPALAGLASGTARTVVALIVLVVCIVVLAALGAAAGGRLHLSLGRVHLAVADSVVGVAVGVAGALLALWVLGAVLASSRYPSFNRALRDSAILRTADRILPPVPDVFARIESFLSARGLPVVFVDLPPGLVTPSALPSDAAVEQAFRAAQASTVKIVGQACGLVQTGSGFVAEPGVVVTNAHVVAGEARTQVLDRSGSHEGVVVLYDPDLDLAVLKVPGLPDPALPLHVAPVARDTTGAVVGYPEGGPLDATPAAVDARMLATGLNIYGTGATTREVYQLNSVVRPGNSGGPLVASGQPDGTAGLQPGTVIGVVFARSPADPQTGYALTMAPVETDLAAAAAAAHPAGTGACLP